ncbi:MAG: bifunctional oligoribonuclease/PAP phosphatase NrnA [Candidatus Omnitrophica bacterium]|nr:bifunctional oligoribonuclease/PAP phosphatase NrnA [Candidatus Omnitrophota bacterium]
MGIREVAEAIRKYDNYLITSHINVEGDAIGSEIALFYIAKQLGKNVIMVNSDPVPARYRFLPSWDKIIIGNNIGTKKYSSVIITDCPTIERSGKIASLLRVPKVKINIINVDHHVSNENFGDFNWVDPDASSCGEMIYRLYKEMGLSITEDVATALYVAILTDTGSFQYDSTTSETHRICADLLKMGIRPAKIAEKIYETKEIGDMMLLSKSLSTIKMTKNGKIAYISVTKKMMEDTRTMPDRTDGFINFARSIDGTEISIFFREDVEDTQKIHVGFRSKGSANVNVLASKFGGGGHPKASGCVLTGPLDKVTAKVLRTAEEFLL